MMVNEYRKSNGVKYTRIFGNDELKTFFFQSVKNNIGSTRQTVQAQQFHTLSFSLQRDDLDTHLRWWSVKTQ